jgi:quercetin dioxygenase-like cupin family protein
MKLTKPEEALRGEPMDQPSHFTGEVTQLMLHEPALPARVAVIRFRDGARTHWHSHQGGQVLHVVEGEGRIQSWGEEERSLRPGDLVTAEPGEKHWHGAAAGRDMAHLSVAVGETTWMEAP